MPNINKLKPQYESSKTSVLKNERISEDTKKEELDHLEEIIRQNKVAEETLTYEV